MERRVDYNYEHLHELEELREQLDLLNKKLDKQQIFAEKSMIKYVKADLKKLNGSGVFYIVMGIFALIYCPVTFYFWNFSFEFVVGTALMLFVCLAYTLYLHNGLYSIDVAKGNLMELSQKVLRLRKGYANWLYVGFTMIIVWCYFLYREALVIYENPEGFMLAAIIGGLLGGVIGLSRHFKVVRDADNLLEHIKEIQNS
ncbi:MAG: hypothetical protein E7127_08980 [Rikenellaceae bacterium]|nr:hypothetical protein [Rikenellaceae bacterium]